MGIIGVLDLMVSVLVWMAFACYVFWTFSEAIWTSTDDVTRRFKAKKSVRKLLYFPPFLLRFIFHYGAKAIMGTYVSYETLRKNLSALSDEKD